MSTTTMMTYGIILRILGFGRLAWTRCISNLRIQNGSSPEYEIRSNRRKVYMYWFTILFYIYALC
jgi:hypothetical protein